ncbi:hypothetical protein W97_04362 [Coniosporium apollinis CBS 100218]|uniref:Mediator of RNA polymerase II transcription subunit 9 n=1 Tax=Coniosporium apollinis (strain CBS 100218) TaxID=1168221 RepID=R7YTC4_CONA1|nr:uncharacterized protein W97_04362 [Coniosporium apollinis CBS 100218]EON65125.1 hypothetical protein W97_04362 [Coniosporium apollinis CBS 100218]
MSSPMQSSFSTPNASSAPAAALPPTQLSFSSPPSLPPPSTFDFLPLVHQLLSRLPPAVASASLTPSGSSNGSSSYPGQPPIEIHQLGAEAGAIKSRIQRARNAVKALPDIQRTLREQEAEIAYLEDRIRQLQNVFPSSKSTNGVEGHP